MTNKFFSRQKKIKQENSCPALMTWWTARAVSSWCCLWSCSSTLPSTFPHHCQAARVYLPPDKSIRHQWGHFLHLRSIFCTFGLSDHHRFYHGPPCLQAWQFGTRGQKCPGSSILPLGHVVRQALRCCSRQAVCHLDLLCSGKPLSLQIFAFKCFSAHLIQACAAKKMETFLREKQDTKLRWRELLVC